MGVGKLKTRRKPNFFWQGLLLVLPFLVLAGFGIVSLRKDRLIAQQEAIQRAQAVADALLPKIWDAIMKTNQPGSDALRVVMLGGDRVASQHFYLLEGDKEPRTLRDLQKAIQARQDEKDRPSLKSIEIVIYEDSVAQDHPAVRDLEKWARQNDLGVTLSKPRGTLP